MSQITLSDIQDKDLRNLVRGALSGGSDKAFARTMTRVHKLAGKHDAKLIAEILRDSPYAQLNADGIAFPTDNPAVRDAIEYSAQRVDIEAYLHQPRLEKYADKLCSAVETLAEINRALLEIDVQRLENAFSTFNEQFGYSRLVAMKAISARHALSFREKRVVDDSAVLRPYLNPTRDMGIAAFAGTCDPSRGYIRHRALLVHLANHGRLPRPDALATIEVLSPLDQEAFSLADRIQRFGHEPLIDFLAHLMRSTMLLEFDGRTADAAILQEIVPPRLHEIWEALFGTIDGEKLCEFVGEDDQFDDLQVYSHLPAWSEYPSLMNFRLKVEAAFACRIDYARGPAEAFESEVVPTKQNISEISKLPSETEQFGDWPYNGQGFGRTLCFLQSIEAGILEIADGEELAELLDRTVDIPRMLTVDEIEFLLPSRPSDKLFEYLRAALLYDADESPIREHALRQCLQDLLIDRYDGDILALLRELDTSDGHVSQHLYRTCTETFLGKLYAIFPEADDVEEAHTQLLEWQGDRRQDEDAVVQARSQRLLIRLRKVRGEIEETRLFVDPLWFMEWFHENVAEDIQNLEPLAEEILQAPATPYISQDQASATLQPYGRLQECIDRCYKEFCSNKVHGAGSYVGRRIRHGTFQGHLVDEIRQKIESKIDSLRSIDPRIAAKLRAWFETYSREVARFAASKLTLRSKAKPDGLIISSLTDSDKSATTMIVSEVVAQALLDKRPISQIGSLIFDFCWVLIDADLRRTLRSVERLRTDFLLDAESLCPPTSAALPKVTECVRELNAEINQRFERAKGWLSRPTNFSPKASVSLLIDAVADEVRSKHVLRLTSEVGEGANIDLIGHRFQHFYDALFILFSNAAEYGEIGSDLLVSVSAQFTDDERFVDLDVVVSSRLDSGNSATQLASIQEAMDAEIDDAMDLNRRSGIPKLRMLSQNIDEIKNFVFACEDGNAVFRLNLRYRLSQAFESTV